MEEVRSLLHGLNPGGAGRLLAPITTNGWISLTTQEVPAVFFAMIIDMNNKLAQKSLIVFDLDGTLTPTKSPLEAICPCACRVLAEKKVP